MRNQLDQFQSLLFEPDDIVGVRCFGGGPVVEKWIRAQKLSNLADDLQALNKRGYNIFAGVNPRKDFRLSGDKNVLLARNLFCDFDHIEPGDGCGMLEFIEMDIFCAGLPQPTLAIQSGHGIHTYWRLDEPIEDMAQWTSIQEMMIKKLGSDPVIKNPERIMRLPGFLNVKEKPYRDCFICWSEAHVNRTL